MQLICVGRLSGDLPGIMCSPVYYLYALPTIQIVVDSHAVNKDFYSALTPSIRG